MQTGLKAQQVLRWLIIVRWIALADLILLIVLLVASFANNEELVQIFGLTHGIVFLALISIVGIGALQKLWSWWFLVATLITTGPPGALVGEVLIVRKAKAILASRQGILPTEVTATSRKRYWLLCKGDPENRDHNWQ